MRCGRTVIPGLEIIIPFSSFFREVVREEISKCTGGIPVFKNL